MSVDKLLIDDLQSLGLTLNEGKVLISIVKLRNSAEVSGIVEISNVPRNKIYQALEGLEKKRIVTKDEIKGSANVYRLLFDNPLQLISYLQNEKIHPIEIAAKRSTDNLAKIVSTRAEKEGVHDVWVIKGPDNISRIEKEIIDSANHTILSNLYPDFLEPIIPNLVNAKKRGVQIKLIMLDEEVDKLNKIVTIDSITTDPVTGISIEKFRNMIEFIPFEGELTENITSTISLFNQFLIKRPNFLLIDPDSKNATSLLIFKSTITPPYSSAIQTQNKDFINSFSFLMNLILNIASNLKTIQEQYSDSY